MQEECAALGVPALVLRERTERPEAIACGGMALIGLDPGPYRRRGREPCAIGSDAERRDPYGDGRAGERIAALLERRMESVRTMRRSPVKIAAGW